MKRAALAVAVLTLASPTHADSYRGTCVLEPGRVYHFMGFSWREPSHAGLSCAPRAHRDQVSRASTTRTRGPRR